MSDQSEPKSQYPELKLPEGGWKSSVPEHLLSETDPATRWIIEELSKNSQAIEWACHGVLDTNAHVRKTNGRLLKAEAQLVESEKNVESLSDKARIMEPLFRPLSQFMGLWEYRLFRWGCYIVAFFLLTYVLPLYLKSPLSIENFFRLLIGQ